LGFSNVSAKPLADSFPGFVRKGHELKAAAFLRLREPDNARFHLYGFSGRIEL
jgi:hypothetical protein